MEPRRLATLPAALVLTLLATSACMAGDHQRWNFLPLSPYQQAPAVSCYSAAPVALAPQAYQVQSYAPAVSTYSIAAAPTVTTYTLTPTGAAPGLGVGLAPGVGAAGGRLGLSDFQRRAILQDLRNYRGTETTASGQINELMEQGKDLYVAALQQRGDDVDELNADQVRDLEAMVELALTGAAVTNAGSAPAAGLQPAGSAPLVSYAPAPAYQTTYSIAPQAPTAYAPQVAGYAPQVGYGYAAQAASAPLVPIGYLVPKEHHGVLNYKFKKAR